MPSSAVNRKEDLAGRDAPALSRGLQQQCPVFIYVEEPALQSGGFQADADRLAKRCRPRSPSGAQRCETILAPAPRPGFEMTGKRAEHARRGYFAQALLGERGGREFGIGR